MQMQIGRFAIDPELREAFLEFARDLVERELASPGCLRFELYEDVSQPNHFMMFEEWESTAALESHLEDPRLVADEETLLRFVLGEPTWDEFEF
ncbi:MAG: antibiotic biosynthesis monooxygenase [Anaerolineae bacterium]|nr:antibiotic biosynthesis monooxygenase [Anaerolineae bacterium]